LAVVAAGRGRGLAHLLVVREVCRIHGRCSDGRRLRGGQGAGTFGQCRAVKVALEWRLSAATGGRDPMDSGGAVGVGVCG
jgi:hypothetical protein